MLSARRVSSVSTSASSSSSGRASVPMMASSAAIFTSTSAMRLASSASPLRTPSTCPSLNPCSQASRSTSVRCMTLTPLAPARGIVAPSTAGRSQRDTSLRCARSDSDILLALAAELDGAFVGQLASGHQDFLLRGLDIREAHRALGLQVALEHFRGALRHVLEDLGLEVLVGALERDEQFVGGDLAQQFLHAAIVDLEQVVEHEHQVLDLLRQRFVALADLRHDVGAD